MSGSILMASGQGRGPRTDVLLHQQTHSAGETHPPHIRYTRRTFATLLAGRWNPLDPQYIQFIARCRSAGRSKKNPPNISRSASEGRQIYPTRRFQLTPPAI